MIKNNEEVRVIDNETKDDITNSTFTQIIFGAEKTLFLLGSFEYFEKHYHEGGWKFVQFSCGIRFV